MDLPSVIPIFALPNVVLFPGVPLPLHIFEPRYRDMVRDAAAGHEVIGMALLRGDWQRSYEERPPIFEIGCAGKLVNVEPLPDGRSNIVLHGLREFAIRRHIFDKSYREAEVTWRVGGQEALPVAQRAALIRTLHGFLGESASRQADHLLNDCSLSDSMLVNYFSFMLGVEPLEKQGLLEAPTLSGRAQRLNEIIEFHLEESRLTLKGAMPDRHH